MKSILLKILKSKWTWIILAIIIVGGYIFTLNKKISNLSNSLDQARHNWEAYENLYNGELSANSALKLSEYELKQSNDSLLRELGYYIEENRRLKEIKEPDIVTGVTEVIHDTLLVEVPTIMPEFKITRVFNPETKITVESKAKELKIIPDISNTIKLEVGIKRVYLNQYKNCWVRFWHFDWRKTDQVRYKFENSNPLIKVTDVKVVVVRDK